MRTENLIIQASRVEIEPNGDTFEVDIETPKSEYEGILTTYRIGDIISIVGTRELLEQMDADEIMGYLNSIGVKTEWE